MRRVLDSEKVEIVVSGTSARMLSREVHMSLRGRGLATVIRPCSFREYLRHRRVEPAEEAQRWTPAQRSLVESHFRAFLVEGGFPEAQGLSNATAWRRWLPCAGSCGIACAIPPAASACIACIRT